MALSPEEMAVFIHLRNQGDINWADKMANYTKDGTTTPDTDSLLLMARMQKGLRENS